ncbi:MAG TPA: hypothetical protein VFQ91_18630 [Bryobacteraceae bacterium]|nr:hypothetical protein [Bryobacteraceae bacterium]
MRLKSYFVHTMEEALLAAKHDLGDDAMLVDSKRLETPPGGKTRLEVIFAASATPPPPPAVPTPAFDLRGRRHGIDQFRSELTNLLDVLSRKPGTVRLETVSPARLQLDALRARLLQAEVPAPTVDEMIQLCRPVLEGRILRGDSSEQAANSAVLPLLAAEWPHVLEPEEARPRVQVLVGPTGAGKTSAIAKLAFRMGVSKGRPISVISIDNLRIGASDQLAHLCSLLGVPFQSLDYSGSLATVLANGMQRGIVLIDTPGYGPNHIDLIEETAQNLARVESLACHLVLPASLRYTEMLKRRTQFAPFQPTRVLFTRIDETEAFGPAWTLARQSGLPAEWVSTGPGIPDDVEEADALRFAAAIAAATPYTAPHAAPTLTPSLANAAAAGVART